jgi:DNA-binding transcriptional LysR family regulator
VARKLPPFASVRAFEAAARHCSFKRAGEELTLTPSAISHQVKSLENFFGLLLFYRHRSSLELTDAGEHYIHDLTEILDQLETGDPQCDVFARELQSDDKPVSVVGIVLAGFPHAVA